MRASFSAQALFAGLLAAFVGFASSFAVVLQGLSAVGASPAQAASGLTALAIAMGLCGIVLSLWRRMPITVAWSTPGAALLAGSAVPEGGFPAAVGAFIAAALLVLVAGLWKPLGRAVARIPAPIANAMLAGVLFGLCLAPVRAVEQMPTLALPVILTWLVVGRLNRLLAVPAAVVVTVGLLWWQAPPMGDLSFSPVAVLVVPAFDATAMVGIALPLFLVAMASQNIPGMAVLNVNGYRPDPGPLFTTTGLFSLAAAPLGGHGVNLAAITAALCAGDTAHPDRSRRWWAAVIAGIGYCLFGLAAGAAAAFIAAAPPILIQAVAGLALLGSFGAAIVAGLSDVADREAAVVTFLVTASGLTVLGIGGAFWGLLAGGAVMAFARWKR
ncbi:benzoate/H(+) symporter BenE family transporter [Roseomonas stagni]|uniref:Benzoate/H(+) symporter BenE family transporter n=1 Tax=Falsiroseomonas algicola TaxID=2716930 RepID=A0A6M1LHL4_9PROT|nr:benzoate/H(+) symporter BenE family transporter [Falsiroseomonas algicola]NGM19404.1 benzoate/H(+) symporter BenE family transporter [Falsiroseomonas algicola]